MPNNSPKIIIDTNLWISFLIGKQSSILNQIILAEKVILIFSNELLSEFLTVAKRSKFNKYFSASDVDDVLELIDKYSVFVKVKTEITICRDPKDNFLLSLAVDGDADYLITGDNDLLVLISCGKTKIITIKKLYEELTS